MTTLNKSSYSASISAEGNLIKVQGVLNFETVPVLAKEAAKILKSMDEAKVNFSEVSDSNSAGLALILEMMRTMQNDKKRISFTDIPEQMLIVARAYGIGEELNSVLNSSS